MDLKYWNSIYVFPINRFLKKREILRREINFSKKVFKEKILYWEKVKFPPGFSPIEGTCLCGVKDVPEKSYHKSVRIERMRKMNVQRRPRQLR